MPKRPFSPEGVQLKMSDLYQLNDSDLITQADFVKSNFRQWMKDNFILEVAQTDSLDGMDDRFIDHASANSALAIVNRLSIIVIRPVIPDPLSKLVELKNDIHCNILTERSVINKDGRCRLLLPVKFA